MTTDLEALLKDIEAEFARLSKAYSNSPPASAYGIACACKCAGLVYAAQLIRARLAPYND